jgi:hypothetical protein
MEYCPIVAEENCFDERNSCAAAIQPGYLILYLAVVEQFKISFGIPMHFVDVSNDRSAKKRVQQW